MQRTRSLIRTIVIAAIASGACASASHREPVAQAGAQLTRVEELPPAAPGTFAGACASRLRDAASGREYLIVHSVVRTETANSASTRTTNLQSALGDYALIGASDQAGPPVARLRVDCTTSRVVAELNQE